MNIVMRIIDRLVTAYARRRFILAEFYFLGFSDGLVYDPDDDDELDDEPLVGSMRAAVASMRADGIAD